MSTSKSNTLSARAIFALPIFSLYFLTACIQVNLKYDLIDSVRLNEVQYIGTHNSYKMHPDSLMIGAMVEFESKNQASSGAESQGIYQKLAYGHLPLEVQLDLGIRLFEFDLHVARSDNPFDPNTLYKRAFGIDPAFEDAQLPDITNDGRILVYHARDHDFRSTCIELIDCLSIMKTWAKQEPDHLPIIIYIEAKSNGGSTLSLTPKGLLTGTPDDLFDLTQWHKVEHDVESILKRNTIYRPKQLTRYGMSLRESISRFGWPLIQDLRGKFLFVVAASDERAKDEYSKIEDPLFFTFRPLDHPDASFVIEFDPFSENIEKIIEQGFIASTYADYQLTEARENDPAKRKRLFAVGAQMISTDFPIRDIRFSDYQVRFSDGSYVTLSPQITNLQ